MYQGLFLWVLIKTLLWKFLTTVTPYSCILISFILPRFSLSSDLLSAGLLPPIGYTKDRISLLPSYFYIGCFFLLWKASFIFLLIYKDYRRSSSYSYLALFFRYTELFLLILSELFLSFLSSLIMLLSLFKKLWLENSLFDWDLNLHLFLLSALIYCYFEKVLLFLYWLNLKLIDVLIYSAVNLLFWLISVRKGSLV